MRSTGPADPPQIGRYQVIRHLATGGMAQIYLARMGGMADFERHVVLKTILANRANDRRFINMFLDEAKLAATLNHQNIAQVYEIDQADGAYFMAMEYVHGENCRAILETSIRKGIQIPIESALLIVSSAAAGLHHAHERKGKTGQALNIVHRDVSPANIMVGYDGSVKVLDFGIAKAEERYTQTVGSTIKGKYGYMSPEQCKGKPIDRRSDIFALGIVLYELTTQRRAFKGRDDFDTMKRIVASDLVLPSTLVASYPQELENIILKTLASDPEQRYPTAQDLIEALDTFTQRAKLTCTNTAMARFMVQLFGEPREPWEAVPVESQRAQSSSPDVSGPVVARSPSAPVSQVNEGEEFDSDDMPTMLSANTRVPSRAHAPTTPAVVRTRTPSVSGGRVQPSPTTPPPRPQSSTTPPPLRATGSVARRPLSPSTPPPLAVAPSPERQEPAPSALSSGRRSPADLFGAPAAPTPLQIPASRAPLPALLGSPDAAPVAASAASAPLALPVVPPRTVTPVAGSSPPPPPDPRTPLGGASSSLPELATRAPEEGPRAQSSVMAPLPVRALVGKHELSSPGLPLTARPDPSGVMAPLPSVVASVVELPPPPEPRLRYRWVVYVVLVAVVAAVGLLIALTLTSGASK